MVKSNNNNHNETVYIISNFIKQEIEKREAQGLVIGMSGGIDSSLTAVLAVKALGNQQVFWFITFQIHL